MPAHALQIGEEVRCTRCQEWHPIATRPQTVDHPSVQRMLFFECHGLPYFAGLIAGPTKLPVRPAAKSES
jgi:hypothetical protein